MPDAPEILFSVTQQQLNSGLRGFPIGTCRTSLVDPIEGVSYVGYPIIDLADLDPEAVIYLLFERSLPSTEQLGLFSRELRASAGLDPRVVDLLRGMPRSAHPMEWLSAGLLFLGMTSKTGDYAADARKLVAQLPELIAAIFRIRSGWGEPVAADPSLGLIESFVHMLSVPGADEAKLTKLLRVFYVLHLDHGGGSLSTFVGKAVASALTDLFSSLSAASAALYRR